MKLFMRVVRPNSRWDSEPELRSFLGSLARLLPFLIDSLRGVSYFSHEPTLYFDAGLYSVTGGRMLRLD